MLRSTNNHFNVEFPPHAIDLDSQNFRSRESGPGEELLALLLGSGTVSSSSKLGNAPSCCCLCCIFLGLPRTQFLRYVRCIFLPTWNSNPSLSSMHLLPLLRLSTATSNSNPSSLISSMHLPLLLPLSAATSNSNPSLARSIHLLQCLSTATSNSNPSLISSMHMLPMLHLSAYLELESFTKCSMQQLILIRE